MATLGDREENGEAPAVPSPLSDTGVRWPVDTYDEALRNPADGLSMLLLLLKSSQWVHRRCESVVFHDDRTVTRRVSVDFTVPSLAPALTLGDDRSVRLIPLTLMRKKTLVHFSLRDHAGATLPLLGLRQTQAATETMLEAWADVLLSALPERPDDDDDEQTRQVRDAIHCIAAGTQDDITEVTAKRHPSTLPADGTLWGLLYADPRFGVVADWMTDSFLLLVALPEEVGARQVVKFCYDEPLTLHYKLDHGAGGTHPRERLTALLGLRPTKIRFPTPAAENCQSYHFEVEAPPGVCISQATMLAGRPQDTKAAPSFDQVSGGFPRVNLHVADVPNGSVSQAQIELRVAREGWLTSAVVASLATTLILSVAWLSVTHPSGAVAKGATTTASDSRSILLAVTGAAVSLLVKPREHGMTSRMLLGIRSLTIVAAALPFIAAGFVIFAPSPWVEDGILSLVILAGCLAAYVFVSWALAGRKKGMISPWEQGQKVEWFSGTVTKSRTYRTYDEAAEANGYSKPATVVASSEGLHHDRPWDGRFERSMEEALQRAVRMRLDQRVRLG